MQYFSKSQFFDVANWFTQYMRVEKPTVIKDRNTEMQLTQARAQALAGALDQNPRGLNLPSYAHHANSLILQAHPISSEVADKFEKKLIELCEQAALVKEKDIAQHKNDPEFMSSMYSCIRLEVDHNPEGILAEAAKEAGISGAFFPMKTRVYIFPDKATVEITQKGKPDVTLTSKSFAARI